MTQPITRPHPRATGQRLLLDVLALEPGVLHAVLQAIAAWLAANLRTVLGSGPGTPPNINAWQPPSTWDRLVTTRVIPAIKDVWTRRWDRADVLANPDVWITHHLHSVRTRLASFPIESWGIVREDLATGIAAGESIPELRDRVAVALDLDATSRVLAERIRRQERILNSPTATRDQQDRARDALRDLHDELDADQGVWQWRAERIARTETASAHNAASYAAAHAQVTRYGDRIGLMWYATGDARTRPTHRAAHGQIRPVGDRFQVGAGWLLFPGDPAGPVGEVVNCRCIAVEVDLD